MSEQEPLQPLSVSQQEALEEATASYQAALTRDAAVYLHGRGIDRATASTFRLGVVHNDPFPGHGRQVGWLAIPYLGHDGRVLSMRFRCLQEHDHKSYFHGKYMSLMDEPSRVFYIPAIHKAKDEIHITEGEVDAITLNMIGLNAVAIPGAQGWAAYHRFMFEGFQRIWVWGDPDDAGAEFTQKVTRSLSRARGVRLRGDDVNKTYVAGGADALLALVQKEK